VTLRIGMIASSNGGVFQALYDILMPLRDYQFTVITDRACGIEEFCKRAGISWKRIEEPDNMLFSQAACKFFQSQGNVDIILLFFLRLVTPELFKHYPTFNIHPSLLPAYPGFNALERTLKSGAKFFGATLHQVNEETDNGPIVAQVVEPLLPHYNITLLNKHSFLQKTYLALLLIDLWKSKALQSTPDFEPVNSVKPFPTSAFANPALSDSALLRAYEEIVSKNILAAL
jgi:phosphoribosylglycinamide formyltransferase-1